MHFISSSLNTIRIYPSSHSITRVLYSYALPHFLFLFFVLLPKAKGDIIVAFMHYGEELTLGPVSSQKHINKHLMSLGVDMIIGAHPHVLQDHCLRDNKLIAYSLGNFLFHTNQPPSAVDPVTHSYGSTSDYKYLLTEWKDRVGKYLGGWHDVNTSPCPILTTSPQNISVFLEYGKRKKY